MAVELVLFLNPIDSSYIQKIDTNPKFQKTGEPKSKLKSSSNLSSVFLGSGRTDQPGFVQFAGNFGHQCLFDFPYVSLRKSIAYFIDPSINGCCFCYLKLVYCY